MSFNIVSARYDLRQKRAIINLQDESSDATIITIESSLSVAPETSEQSLLLEVEKAALQALVGAAKYLSATAAGSYRKPDPSGSHEVAELRETSRVAQSVLRGNAFDGSRKADAA